MVKSRRETPAEHDALGGISLDLMTEELKRLAPSEALPTPTTPGYTTFTDYLGHQWTCCVCMKEFLTYAQMCWLKLGWITTGIDVWQLTGNASASVGTHSLGGVGDLLYQTADKFVNWLRDHGATAAWRRTTAQGFTAVHVHFCLRGCKHLAPAAATQVVEEQNGPPSGISSQGYHGGDGLAGTAFDYHRDPSPYMDWDAGVALMKKELGLLALTTTTNLVIAPNPLGSGCYASTSARTLQSGTAYALGTHIYEYLPAGTTVWKAFKTLPLVNGGSQFLWNYGGPQPIRARFVPKDVNVSKASTSSSVVPQVINIPTMQNQVKQLTADKAALAADNAALTADKAALTQANVELQEKLDACLNPPNPPEPVPAYGVDVSGWQTVQQVQELAADPTNQFVIIKATEGLAFHADTFGAQLEAAGDKFLGAYHYTGTPGNGWQAEGDNFLGYTGEVIYKNFKSWLDVETAVSPTFVLGWLDYIQSVTGISPIWYTNWKWLPPLRLAATPPQWDHLCDFGLWFAEVASPGKITPISPQSQFVAGGSTRVPTMVLHQYAYTPDGMGNEIDRNWTPDLNALKAA